MGAEGDGDGDVATADVKGDGADVVDGDLADGGVIDMTDGDEDDPREVHWRWRE